MEIAIDTNIFVQDFWLESPSYRVFFEELKIIPATIQIPEIVIDETINKYREFIKEKYNELKKNSSDLSRFLKRNLQLEEINLEKESEKYEKFLREKLKSTHATIIKYPETKHKDIVKRILERRKPFKKNDSGYRDYLIWESIKKLETWGGEKIVFLTNNIKDFAEGEFLSKEFFEGFNNYTNFRISTSISKFNEEYILPRLKKLEVLNSYLSKENIGNFNFKQWLDNEFINLLDEEEFMQVLTGFPPGTGSVRITKVIMFEDYQINNILQMDSDDKILNFTIKCLVNVSIDVDWDDYSNHIEVRDYFGETEGPFDSWFTVTSEKIEARGILIIDKSNQDAKSSEITYIKGPYYSMDLG